jgi:hypothetical protein
VPHLTGTQLTYSLDSRDHRDSAVSGVKHFHRAAMDAAAFRSGPFWRTHLPATGDEN